MTKKTKCFKNSFTYAAEFNIAVFFNIYRYIYWYIYIYIYTCLCIHKIDGIGTWMRDNTPPWFLSALDLVTAIVQTFLPGFWQNNNAYRCLRGWRLSASWVPNWNPSGCHSTVVLRGFRGEGGFGGGSIIPRDASFSLVSRIFFPVHGLLAVGQFAVKKKC